MIYLTWLKSPLPLSQGLVLSCVRLGISAQDTRWSWCEDKAPLQSYYSGVVEQGTAPSTCKLLLQRLKSSSEWTGSSKTSKTVFATENVFLLCSYKAQGSGAWARSGCSAAWGKPVCAGLTGRLSWGCHGREVSWEERSLVNLSML